MVRNNHIISKNHFKKNWKDHVKVKLNEEFRKRRRSLKRMQKAVKIAPRPIRGPMRPLVQCPTIRYHTKARYGRGFTLFELKSAGLNQEFAKTIGISVDYRRRDKSYDVIQRNVQRLKEYMSKLVLYPKNRKKLCDYESPEDICLMCNQMMGKVMPIQKCKKVARAMKVGTIPNIEVYMARRLAKLAEQQKSPKYKARKTRVTFE